MVGLLFPGVVVLCALATLLVVLARRKRPSVAVAVVSPSPPRAIARALVEVPPAPRLPVIDEPPPSVPPGVLPKIAYEDEDVDNDPTTMGAQKERVASVTPPCLPIVYDEEAADNDPTGQHPLIVTSGWAQSDKGLRRKENEDNLLVADAEALYVVADGMGGYAGGAIASEVAVETLRAAFGSRTFTGERHPNLPRQASELVRAIQMANLAILDRAKSQTGLEGMGTTVCAAAFSPNKQRLYIGHVGDSRVYRLRDKRLEKVTDDHTLKAYGVGGPTAAHLSRAVGIWPEVPVDVLFVKPKPEDFYLLCTDGLTKMVPDEVIETILLESIEGALRPVDTAVERLVERANENGGKDNVTAILIRVDAAPLPS